MKKTDAADVRSSFRPVNKTSGLRKLYIGRLVFRAMVFIASLFTAFYAPNEYSILEGRNFFRRFSPFHVLWIIWILGMLIQLIPIRNALPLGAQKVFEFRFKPIREKINYNALRRHIIETTKAAYKVMLIWVALTAVLSVLRWLNVINDTVLFLISTAFYVCDLICVLFWCPFRLLLRTRCCTTCRIFNWDHLMMFTPMIAVNGFYSRSLVIMAILVWLIWELCVMMYPERFWENSNEALRCANCTDRLCLKRKPNPEDIRDGK